MAVGYWSSATQVEDWYLCQRKWGFRRLAKFAPNIGAFRGDSAHKLLEAYGRDNTPPEHGEAEIVRGLAAYADDLAEKNISAEDYAARIVAVVNKMTPLLPAPPWERVEAQLKTTIDGVTWSGKIDLEYGNTIRDHKITSSPDFALDEETIRTNVQSLLYAYDLLKRKPEFDEVNIGWTYGLPGKTARAWVVETVFKRDYVVTALQPHNETAKKFVKLRTVNPLALEPNWASCEKYGGCEFQHICQPTPDQLIAAYMADTETQVTGETTMGLLSNLKSKDAPTTAPSSAPASTPASTPATAPRSDTAGAVADCQKDAASLLGLGLPRAEVVKALQARYVGIAPMVDALVPAGTPAVQENAPSITTGQAPKQDAPATGNGAALNPPSAPAEEPKAEAKGKRASKAKGDGDPWQAARLDLIERIMADTTISTLEAANAIAILRPA